MKELHSKVPADAPVDVKNVKTLNTSDGYAMTATLYFNGKRIAEVENHGTGGSNFYHPLGYGGPEADRTEFDANRAALAEAEAYASRWEGSDYSDNLGLLIEEIMRDKDLARDGRKEAKRGAKFVALAMKGPYTYEEGADADPEEADAFAETYIVAAESREAFVRDAERRGYDAYRVLHEG